VRNHTDGEDAVEEGSGGHPIERAVPRPAREASGRVVEESPLVPLQVVRPVPSARRRVDCLDHVPE
jgi:hypothetical protein